MNMMFYLWILIKLVTGFAFVLAYLNISGRTQFSQMNAIDLIGNFVLGGVIGGVLYTDTISFHTYIIVMALSILVLLVLNIMCRRFDLFRNVAIGRPIPIILNGHFLINNIENQDNKVDLLNVISQLNLQGIFSFDQVSYAQIEPNGSLTATCDPTRIPAPIVLCRGVIRDSELEDIHKTRDDLLEDMKSLGIASPDDVLIAEYRITERVAPGHEDRGAGMAGHFHYVCMNGQVLPHWDAKPAQPVPPPAQKEEDASSADAKSDQSRPPAHIAASSIPPSRAGVTN